jgi:hypothetical protein
VHGLVIGLCTGCEEKGGFCNKGRARVVEVSTAEEELGGWVACDCKGE